MKAYKQKGAKDFSTVYTITSKNGNEISIKQNVTGFAGNEYYITERKDGVEITRAYGSWDGNERLDISDEGNQRLDEITVIDLKSGSKMLIDYSGKDIPSSIEIDDL